MAKKTNKSEEPVLLSGGNPQIAKGEGDAPVQAYIDAIPGWKQAAARHIDELIAQAVPQVNKAVKWNSPFYGMAGMGWFLNFHCFTKYIKVAFFKGAHLDPVPPVAGKDETVRYYHISEEEPLDDALFTKWVKQAAAIPGWQP